MTETEMKALVSLLDDEDINIINEIEGKILTMGSQIVPFLEQEWESNFNPIVQKRIEDLLHSLSFDTLKENLIKWKNKGADDLLEGLVYVANYQYPDLELKDVRKDLEQLYYEAWLEFKSDLTPVDQIKILNGVIFSKLKFSANTKNFHSPGNSMINVVLESKKGNPISLCIIYMMIAQKLKLPVYGVNLPNLFILTYKSAENQFYINAFNKGLIFSKKDIDNYLNHLNLPPKEEFYEPCDNMAIVNRTLRNIFIALKKAGETEKMKEIEELLSIFE